MNTDTWIDMKVKCKLCGSMIVVCQSKDKDYHYYCSQKQCKNHQGIETYDDENYPDFLEEIEWEMPKSMLIMTEENKHLFDTEGPNIKISKLLKENK